MIATQLDFHARVPRSRANGPGLRAVIWTQGCSLRCPGCFNPETHERGGTSTSVSELLQWVRDADVEGVTMTGGEPLDQPDAVLELAQACRDDGLSVIVLTGYSFRGLRACRPAVAARVESTVDVLIAGRYVPERRLASGLRGSSNKRIHLFSGRYTEAEVEATPPAEVLIAPDGTVILTGVDPLRLPRAEEPAAVSR